MGIRGKGNGMELLLCKLIVLEAFKNIRVKGFCVDKFDGSCYDGF